jgi:hypothetical protein
LSQKFDSSLILNINLSYFLIGLLALLHLGAALLVGIVPLQLSWRAGLWVALLLSLYHAITRHGWRRGRRAIATVVLDSEGELGVYFAGNETAVHARIISRFIHPWLSVLSLRCADRRWPVSLIVAQDAVDPETFRRWRARLKLQNREE